jgi:hypothetical protein
VTPMHVNPLYWPLAGLLLATDDVTLRPMIEEDVGPLPRCSRPIGTALARGARSRGTFR